MKDMITFLIFTTIIFFLIKLYSLNDNEHSHYNYKEIKKASLKREKKLLDSYFF
jgi:large-conductance mechanosensitive channel